MTGQDSVSSTVSSTGVGDLSPIPRVRQSLPFTIVLASKFTFEELVAAYNQTRVDYIVPMPMNAPRLRDYVRSYDVDLDASGVALLGDQIPGLGMLGVRAERAWITRLGVLPVRRRRGIGQAIAEYLIAQARRLKVSYVVIDVIENNTPAHCLFRKLGFDEVRELLVIRRPPGFPAISAGPYTFQMLGSHQARGLLQHRRDAPSWLQETASLENAGNLEALRVELKSGGWGWVVYQETIFQLRRLVLQTEAGDPHEVGLALLHALHTSHPHTDTASENLPADDPHWPAMQAMGYIESFRRIEMRLDLA